MLGTEGFAPPEAYDDSHAAGFSWDAYSLGRLVAWATTGSVPAPLREMTAPEPWRRFVRVLTSYEPRERPQDLSRVLELLSHVGSEIKDLAGVPDSTLTAAKGGDAQATAEVLHAAREYADDEAFFIDDLAMLIGRGLDSFVRAEPRAARFILSRMDFHLEHVSWGRRSFDHYNVPLHWMQRVAQAAADAGHFDLLEDACAALFRHEPRLDRWEQKRRSQAWLSSLNGTAAARVAQVLREHPDALPFYGPMKNASDPLLRGILNSART